MESNKNEKFELFKKIYRLNGIKRALKDKDPKKVENSLFSKFGCRTQRDRISFELRYVLTKLNNDESSYKQHPDYTKDIEFLNLISGIRTDRLRPKDIKGLKKSIALIELKYEIPIGFVSIVDELLVELNERFRHITEQD